MFTRNPKEKDREETCHHLAIIGEGIELHGDLVTSEDLRICGALSGSIISQSKVVIASTSSVQGDISCREAEIHGRVKGNLNIDGVLRLKGNAMVEGDITASLLQVEEGVYLLGRCSMHGRSTNA